MSLISWIILGLIAGCITTRLVVGHHKGLLMNTVLGVVGAVSGAVAGGKIMTLLGRHEGNGLNIYSMALAVAGAIIVLAAVQIARR